MRDYLPLLASLIALLAGLVVGKAWERYKLRDGRWIDRRRLRQTPHYMLGLTFLVQGDVDEAIEALTHASNTDADALELQLILGNLLREKGQVARAITIHQSLLQRPRLTQIEHAYILLCLGLDYRHAGFIDRAIEALTQVRALDPGNRHALLHLQKLYEEQHQWADALRARETLMSLQPERSGGSEIAGFLHNEIGREARSAGDLPAATRAFSSAIDADARTAPAYVNLGDLREQQGNVAGAVEAWEALARAVPARASLVTERLERGYRALGQPTRFTDYCRRVIAEHPQDWRTRLALARHVAAAGSPDDAFGLLLEALPHNPHGLVIHQEIWRLLMAMQLRRELVERYVGLTRDAVFYLDPHICRGALVTSQAVRCAVGPRVATARRHRCRCTGPAPSIANADPDGIGRIPRLLNRFGGWHRPCES
jgi:lipopolysaccharide biosynthesis regulator YciM